MRILCPNCHTRIENENINVAENICVCRSCNQLYKLSEMQDQEKIEETENLLRNPPKGISVKKDSGSEIITISAKSKSAVIVLLFALIASGLIGFILSLVLAQKTFIIIAFLAPFAVIITALWAETFFLAFGKIELVINKKEPDYLFKGIGAIGKKYFIDWPSIKNISEVTIETDSTSSMERTSGAHLTARHTSRYIHIEGKKLIKLAINNLNKEKSELLVNVLKYYKEKKLMFQQFK